MRVIDDGNLRMPPHCCGITRRSDGAIVDFEREIVCNEPPHLYLHESIVREAAELLGYVPEEKVDAMEVELKNLGDQIEELKNNLDLIQRTEEMKERMTA